MVRPQLAIEYSKVKNLDLSQGYYASRKLDGLRCLFLDGVAYSRSMKPFRNIELQWFAKEYADELEGMDGELISGSPTSPTAFRNSTSVVMSEQGGSNFTFYVFDNIRMNYGFNYRCSKVAQSVHEFNHPKVVLVEHVLIHSQSELLSLEEKYLAEGYEGIMLNDQIGYYKQGRSGTKNPELIKKKLFSDSEFMVVGYECLYINKNAVELDNLGYTKRSTIKKGMIPVDELGALELITPEGKNFFCGTGFDDKTRAELWGIKDDLIGKCVKVKYFEQGGYEVPRHPVFLGFRDEMDM